MKKKLSERINIIKNLEKLQDNPRLIILVKIILLLFFMFAAAALIPSKHTTSFLSKEVLENEINPKDIISPITFKVPKTQSELKEDILYLRSTEEPELKYADNARKRQLAMLDSLAAAARFFLKDNDTLYINSADSIITINKRKSYEKYINTILGSDFHLKELPYYLGADSNYFHPVIIDYFNESMNNYFMKSLDTLNKFYFGDSLYIVNSIHIEKIHKKEIITSDELREYLTGSYILNKNKINELISFAEKAAIPNLYFDFDKYNGQIENQLNRTKRIIREGEKIIGAHELVTKESAYYLKLLKDNLKSSDIDENILNYITNIILICVISIIIAVYLYKEHKRIFNSLSDLVLLELLILGFLVSASILSNFGDMRIFLVPAAALSMIITIVYNSKTSLFFIFVSSLICTIYYEYNLIIFVMFFSIGFLSIYMIRNIHRRYEFVKSLAGIFLGYVFWSILWEVNSLPYPDIAKIFEQGGDLLKNLGFGLLNSVYSTIITIGILPFIEQMFGITTDITLLELTDNSLPLLDMLRTEAPGTFNHSMYVSLISEKAAEGIGANPLLARVGGLYHDIGKVEIPEYFIENQYGINKHDELNPSVSAMLIISHVKRGVNLAKKYKVPDAIINIIQQHHGTTLVSYFYNKAVTKAAEDEKVDESTFQYPGPKPQTKEAAIVMIADSIESAVRSIKEPTSSRIETMITNVIEGKLNSGALDESGITFKDLGKLKEVVFKLIVSMFHARIEYPGSKKNNA